jgi:hypothetical protein
MESGEQAQLIAVAKVGSFPVKKNVVAGAVAVAIGAALGGGVIMAFAPAETYMLLTDRQLLFFAANRQTGGPGKYLFGIPRQAIRPTVLADEFYFDVQLDIEGSDKGIRLKFPPLPPSGKKLGRQMIASLESGASADASTAATI